MKRTIIYGLCSLYLFHCIGSFASQTTQKNSIDELQTRTQQLEEEINYLRNELTHIEKKAAPVRNPSPVACRYVHPRPCPCAAPKPVCPTDNCPPLPNGDGPGKDPQNNYGRLLTEPSALSMQLYTMGATVTTSPFLGLRSAFDASDVIVNLPTMNEDLRFLKEHVELQKQLRCRGLKLPDRPIIELSGKIEGVIYAQEDYNDGTTTSDINLGGVRLDVLAEISPGVHGYIAFNMDNSTLDILNNTNLDIQLAGGISRIFNSRVFVSRAFLTIGDLCYSPFYFTIGQMFVPFGRYASNMVTAPLPLLMFRTNERAALVGYFNRGLYASVYAYRGDTELGAPGIDEWGANFGYEYKWCDNSVNLGVGYISNVGDATGMQVTGATRGFFGFARNTGTETLNHRVPGFDAHAELSFGHLSLIGEVITTTRAFAFEDLNYNGHGAKLSAMNAEAAYSFKIVDRPASVAVGYTKGWQALALNVPEESFISAFNISIWKNTIESIEFRHDNNYSASDFGGGLGAIPSVINSVGGSRNTYTFQIGAYF